jgi:CopG family nickel-responsive transcriptional regulator
LPQIGLKLLYDGGRFIRRGRCKHDFVYYDVGGPPMDGEGVIRFSVSVPPSLLKDFDEMISQMGYDRSKAIQIAMRNFLTDYRWAQERGQVVGAITILYDHETRGLEETLTDIQHEYRDVISSTTHIHLDERNCLEILAVKGEVKSIQDLAKKLMVERGVKQLRLSTLSFEPKI